VFVLIPLRKLGGGGEGLRLDSLTLNRIFLLSHKKTCQKNRFDKNGPALLCAFAFANQLIAPNSNVCVACNVCAWP
jgi:hypothetical protein